ncbi:MAG: sarcosine oxidase subunit beta family protein [Emcibacter sp.]|nr:sarcosine oxidase subunit beta family protein [Emcibacter sp.]
MSKYSIFSLVKGAADGHMKWPLMWRAPDLKPKYDVVIIGGGGHGLATAYYLAKVYGIRNVAVIEKGWIGGGNTGRNTTIVRSNYYYPESAAIYDFSLRLYEGLSQDLNFNIMLSQRGELTLAQSPEAVEIQQRQVNAMRLNNIDAEYITVAQLAQLEPLLNLSPNSRFPVLGGTLQRRGGTVRHDAVAWGYARAADRLGVDIIQNCEVTGFKRNSLGAIEGVETTKGTVLTSKVGMAVAGHSSVLAARAGFRLPVSSFALQAMVTEPVKPTVNTVVSSLMTGVYISQSDKGELVIGGMLDRFPSYGQRGSFATTEAVLAGILEMFPCFSRLRIMRQWAGIVDYTHDSSPIIGPSPVPGLYLNCGWGGGGFKAIPAGGYCLAHILATGVSHAFAEPFSLDRFRTGALIDEAAAAGIEH